MNIDREVTDDFQDLQNRYTRLKSVVFIEKKQKELEAIEKQTMKDGFWDDSKKAQQVSQKGASLRKNIEQWNNLTDVTLYLEELMKLDDASNINEIKKELLVIEKSIESFETQVLLCGEYDHLPALITLQVGNGGQDAEDFTNILYRMYLRFGETNNFGVTILDESTTDDGLKSATIRVEGDMAYGLLQSENGVHRLIRQSPFNAKGLRQTSFARVEVTPEIEQDSSIVLEEKDVRVDVFRASGNGGQSVNTTDSAVRITYIPLGLSVSCQNEKSQLQNKQTAFKILKSRLLQLQKQQQAKEISDLRGDVMENSFGSQIRTYTLHPYKLAKDHRTNKEHNDPSKVFDGDIFPFIYSYLQHESSK